MFSLTVYTHVHQNVFGDVLTQFALLLLRAWFFVYDCLNYLPYQLFNPPAEKLRLSSRVKAKFEKRRDGSLRNVDGPLGEYYQGQDTIDKVGDTINQCSVLHSCGVIL